MKTLITLFLSLSIIYPTFSQKKKALFNGKDYTGWHTYNKGGISDKWVVEDGTIHLTGKGGGDIVTDVEYESFILEYEWKISEGGNSGIMWAVVEDKKICCPYLTGPEMQVLDDAKHPDSFAGKSGNHKAGALYDMIPPAKLDAVKPAMQWNKAKMKIDHKNNKGTFWLNGIKVVEFDLSGANWDALVANSKFAKWNLFAKSKKGKICLQDHGDKVWYRSLKIKEL
jgi:hypothetical protein